MEKKELLEHIKSLIKQKGFTQADYARMLDMHPQNLSKIFTNYGSVSDAKLNEILKPLGKRVVLNYEIKELITE